MFDFGWWELAIVGLIMILVLGPKELPHAMRSIARLMRKARRLASEFQGHMDELIREADLDDVKQTVRSIKNQDVNALIENTVDPSGELKKQIDGTMADAKREMTAIKSSAGPTPSAPITSSEPKKEDSSSSTPAIENTSAAETSSTAPTQTQEKSSAAAIPGTASNA